MSHDEIRSIITIALMAAFADGMKDERERAAVKQLAEALDSDGSLNLAALYRDVLMAKPDLATVAGTLQSTESRQLAYEMAVGVCDADDVQDAAEREFLARLATALGLPASQASAISPMRWAVNSPFLRSVCTARSNE